MHMKQNKIVKLFPKMMKGIFLQILLYSHLSKDNLFILTKERNLNYREAEYLSEKIDI